MENKAVWEWNPIRRQAPRIDGGQNFERLSGFASEGWFWNWMTKYSIKKRKQYSGEPRYLESTRRYAKRVLKRVWQRREWIVQTPFRNRMASFARTGHAEFYSYPFWKSNAQRFCLVVENVQPKLTKFGPTDREPKFNHVQLTLLPLSSPFALIFRRIPTRWATFDIYMEMYHRVWQIWLVLSVRSAPKALSVKIAAVKPDHTLLHFA